MAINSQLVTMLTLEPLIITEESYCIIRINADVVSPHNDLPHYKLEQHISSFPLTVEDRSSFQLSR